MHLNLPGSSTASTVETANFVFLNVRLIGIQFDIILIYIGLPSGFWLFLEQAFGLLDDDGKKKPTRGKNAPAAREAWKSFIAFVLSQFDLNFQSSKYLGSRCPKQQETSSVLLDVAQSSYSITSIVLSVSFSN